MDAVKWCSRLRAVTLSLIWGGVVQEELLVAAALYLRKFRPSDRAKLAGSRCFGLVAVHLGSNQIIHANERFGKLGFSAH